MGSRTDNCEVRKEARLLNSIQFSTEIHTITIRNAIKYWGLLTFLTQLGKKDTTRNSPQTTSSLFLVTTRQISARSLMTIRDLSVKLTHTILSVMWNPLVWRTEKVINITFPGYSYLASSTIMVFLSLYVEKTSVFLEKHSLINHTP